MGTLVIMILDILFGLVFAASGVVTLTLMKKGDAEELRVGMTALFIGIVFLMSGGIISKNIF